MPRHALSADEFAEYAREQIRTADALLARHRPVSRTYCHCAFCWPASLGRIAVETFDLARLVHGFRRIADAAGGRGACACTGQGHHPARLGGDHHATAS